MTDMQAHWDEVWQDRDPAEVSWFQAEPATSLRLLQEVCPDRSEPVVDIGGGASRLVDRLLEGGWSDVTVVDIAEDALSAARARLGDRAQQVRWVTADVTRRVLDRPVTVWHDRAVFHFLTDDADRAAYVERCAAAVRRGGHVVVATFAADGPETCSGLPVRRHGPAELAAAFGDRFTPLHVEREVHRTPSGSDQAFTVAVLRRGD